MADNLKILYAASNNYGSRIQLERFVNAIKNQKHYLKIAAYKKSSPANLNIDWTLDCLYNIFKPEHISLDNENFETYFYQVKSFNPDLIISDLEYFTSHIAFILNTTLWQCSSSLLNFALSQEQKYNLGLFKRFYYLFHKIPLNNQRIMNMIDNSNCNFVYSHLGDANSNLKLKQDFSWIRPYHSVGKSSVICKHNLVAGMIQPNKNIIGLLKRYEDSVIFSENCNEDYPNIILKDIKNIDEYTCNLYNSNLFICGGQTSFLADAFYNGKYSLILPDYNDTECIVNSVASERFKLSDIIYDLDDNLDFSKSIITQYDENIKFLHEIIGEI
jgi:hypothetical protein